MEIFEKIEKDVNEEWIMFNMEEESWDVYEAICTIKKLKHQAKTKKEHLVLLCTELAIMKKEKRESNKLVQKLQDDVQKLREESQKLEQENVKYDLQRVEHEEKLVKLQKSHDLQRVEHEEKLVKLQKSHELQRVEHEEKLATLQKLHELQRVEHEEKLEQLQKSHELQHVEQENKLEQLQKSHARQELELKELHLLQINKNINDITDSEVSEPVTFRDNSTQTKTVKMRSVSCSPGYVSTLSVHCDTSDLENTFQTRSRRKSCPPNLIKKQINNKQGKTTVSIVQEHLQKPSRLKLTRERSWVRKAPLPDPTPPITNAKPLPDIYEGRKARIAKNKIHVPFEEEIS